MILNRKREKKIRIYIKNRNLSTRIWQVREGTQGGSQGHLLLHCTRISATLQENENMAKAEGFIPRANFLFPKNIKVGTQFALMFSLYIKKKIFLIHFQRTASHFYLD